MCVRKNAVLYFCLLFIFFSQAQEKPVKVVEKQKTNRLDFYAINEDEKPYDVLFEVKGTDFRQSAARPRWIRVPATSRVHLKTIILLRGKTPKYTHILKINDSLSRRALKKEFTIVEVPPKMIKPKKHITIYATADCSSCDSIVKKLNDRHYIFKHIKLQEQTEIQETLARALNQSLDSLSTPIVNLGGHLYTWIMDYETLLTELEK